MPRIAVIATVLNEGDSIRAMMDSLAAQTRQPDEVIIVDGGSSDSTIETLNQYASKLPLTVLAKAGSNISAGRNYALEAASSEIIAITDAGVVLVPEWLEQITKPLRENAAVGVVSGFFRADVYTVFEAALGATTLPLVEEIDPATFLPSSRSVAVRRQSALQVGGYPEWLDYCEDLIFDLRLKQVTQFAFAPEAIAYFRPRPTLTAFFKQYYRYARGDGKADLFRKRHAVRYMTYLVVAPALLMLSVWVHPLFWWLFLICAAIYLFRPYARLPKVLDDTQKQNRVANTFANRFIAGLYVPVIRVAGDTAKMLGYPAGWRWRRQHQPPNWRKIE